ncbi:hypothetical protein AFB00_27860 [Pseudonocardia sp. HH130630-07]|nr:hypothetical protein AFB00_27860 [Pseudonocardia sp. HH130630-07]
MDVEARRAQLMASGVRLFTERPYDDVEIGTIAHEAGVSRGLLYRYFPDKASFFAEVVADRLVYLAGRSTPDPALPLLETSRAAIDGYLDVVGERPQWYVSMYRGSASSAAPVRDVLARFDEELVTGLLTLFGADDTELTRVLVRGWLAYLAAIGMAVVDGAEVDRPALREQCLRVLASVAESVAPPGGGRGQQPGAE